MGAPSKYPTHVEPRLDEVLEWKGNGLTDEEIANNLGISHQTLITYKQQFPEFLEAIKTGKNAADCKVINAMFKRAIGYEYEEVTTVTRKGPDGTTTETRVVKKQEAPNTTACIFWLKNRCPEHWRDRHENELTNPDGKPIEITIKNEPAAPAAAGADTDED